MTADLSIDKPIIITDHARMRMKERGAREEDVLAAVRVGEREPARDGRILCRLTLEFKREWDGKYYGAQQVVPIVVDGEHEIVVVTVLTFYIREQGTL